jgi:uncharacterized protein
MSEGDATSTITTNLASLAAALSAEGADAVAGLPPVHTWHPTHCGEIGIRITADGVWLHEGVPIRRPALVRLFSTVLRLDPDGYHLVTPAEKLRIEVEDAPFVAVRVDVAGEVIRFETNVADIVEAGPDHAIRVIARSDGTPRPYLDVRHGLLARLSRPVYYELAARAEARNGGEGGALGVWSRGEWFSLAPPAAG